MGAIRIIDSKVRGDHHIIDVGDHMCVGGPYIHVGDHMICVPYKVRGTIKSYMWGIIHTCGGT